MAQNIVDDAIERKSTEEIFKHNEHFLKIFRLENHEIAYKELKEFAIKREKQETEKKKAIIEEILSRAK